MAADLDGFAILRRIGEEPERFGPVRGAVQAAARALLLDAVGAAAPGLSGLRDVLATVGEPGLRLLLDGLAERPLRALARRLDRHNPDLRVAAEDALRDHLCRLARGEDAVAASTPRPPAPAASIFSPAFSAVWDGQDQ